MEAGIRIERHDDHFAQDTPDTEWLAEIGKRGWFVLTHDGRIRYKPNEQEAVFQAVSACLCWWVKPLSVN
ncbi:MAG: hypothetical protein R3F37_13265 [Candidatus Competibacteraceae bacterium]